MPTFIPFLGRISFTDYVIVLLVTIETLLTFLLNCIPQSWIDVATTVINAVTRKTLSPVDDMAQQLRDAKDIHEMGQIFGIDIEDHIVRTEDDYLLTLHRIVPNPANSNGQIVYLHHGLLMCSDVWMCHTARECNLPLVLYSLGFDVWMGNNRGNKYSTQHLYKRPGSHDFWDFSIDEFAFFDIPNSIEFVLAHTHSQELICIGFSQGSSQTFAALSVREDLNEKISLFVAIAPAMTPQGLHNRIIDTLLKSSPRVMYLFFGNRILLPSATVWQKTLHPTIFNVIIDIANRFLFNWKSLNISSQQKHASYAKLYSTTSVKSVVHWFQILHAQKFQMFEEHDIVMNSWNPTRSYQITTFPTRTSIRIPVLLLYGGSDSLVDIEVMKSNLPASQVFDIMIPGHEHLDLLWGRGVADLVIPNLLRFIWFFKDVKALEDETALSSVTELASPFTKTYSDSFSTKGV
ncbi:LANO_0D07624g1_1 [Lachancea nothofagi CBS 11611]|uniref:LANO_0D07624g1_1 n=1 Tax=Lachancea nothofagi CBS 11611 TaxID=1266666 RepID=A0A1G4JIY4_9SACH|nr:LANO_0D07624g1_1 [Lachancea nothofagi CBS 11611]